MIETSSSCIRAVGYNRAGGALTVEFPGGRRYVYAGVPESLVKRLLWARSRGRFFSQHIRPLYRGRPVAL